MSGGRMANRRVLFLPVWLFLMVSIGGAGVYFGYRAPAIVAALVLATAAVAGVLSFAGRVP